MEARDLSGTTAVVTGASRGFGRAIAAALIAAGAEVGGLARDEAELALVRDQLGERFIPIVGDATDSALAEQVLAERRPKALVLNAGASSPLMPLTKHTWQTFSLNWQVDVQQAFYWTQQALALPLAPGSTVVEMSSGAAVRGSPRSGGYAGAKAAIKFIAAYAAEQSHRDGLGIRFTAVLPQLTPTGLGAPAVAAYAEMAGVDVPTFLARSGPAPTPEDVGDAVLDLITSPDRDQPAYFITAAGLTPPPQ